MIRGNTRRHRRLLDNAGEVVTYPEKMSSSVQEYRNTYGRELKYKVIRVENHVTDHVTPIPFMLKGDVHVSVKVAVSAPSSLMARCYTWQWIGILLPSFVFSISLSLTVSRRRRQQHLHDADIAFFGRRKKEKGKT